MFWHIPPAHQDQGNHPPGDSGPVEGRWGTGTDWHLGKVPPASPPLSWGRARVRDQALEESQAMEAFPEQWLEANVWQNTSLLWGFAQLGLSHSWVVHRPWNEIGAGRVRGEDFITRFANPTPFSSLVKGGSLEPVLSIKLRFPKERVPSDPTSQLGVTGKCQPAKKALKDSKPSKCIIYKRK